MTTTVTVSAEWLALVEDTVYTIKHRADDLVEATNADDAYDAKCDLEAATVILHALLTARK